MNRPVRACNVQLAEAFGESQTNLWRAGPSQRRSNRPRYCVAMECVHAAPKSMPPRTRLQHGIRRVVGTESNQSKMPTGLEKGRCTQRRGWLAGEKAKRVEQDVSRDRRRPSSHSFVHQQRRAHLQFVHLREINACEVGVRTTASVSKRLVDEEPQMPGLMWLASKGVTFAGGATSQCPGCAPAQTWVTHRTRTECTPAGLRQKGRDLRGGPRGG